jgi:hypothetical protein
MTEPIEQDSEGPQWVPEELVRWWRAAFAKYERTTETATAEPNNWQAARAVATAVRTMAEVWRGFSQVGTLPAWAVVAARIAEQQCLQQARSWEARATLLATRPWWVPRWSFPRWARPRRRVDQ